MESWFHLLLAHKDIAAFAVRMDEGQKGRHVFDCVSDAFYRLSGYGRDQVQGFSAQDFMLAHDAQTFNDSLEHCRQIAAIYSFYEFMVLPGGRVCWNITLYPVRDEKGAIKLIHGVALDLTDHKRMEQALQEAERKNQALIAAMPDAIFKISSDGVFLDMEAGKDTVIGIAPVQFLGQTLEQAFPKEAAALARKHIAEAFKTGRTQLFEYQFRIDNIPHDYEVRIVAIRDKEVLAIVRDITSRKAVERELRIAKEQAEVASRAKTSFLATVSHELRTPLNAIIGFSDVIRNQMLGPIGSERYRDYAQDIHDSGSHLLDIINDILDLSKLEAGKVVLNEEVFDANFVIRSAIHLMEGRIADGKLQLGMNLSSALPQLKADKRALKQVMINLLSNAVKFTPEGGSISVSSYEESSGGITICVEDTGIGIAPEDIPVAMQPFSQIDSSLSRKHPGTGLGLPLVKSLVELHQGNFRLDSAIGCGTKAYIRFPQSRAMTKAPPQSAEIVSLTDIIKKSGA